MPNTSTLRYQKKDKFNNPIFIVNSKDEPKEHKKLAKYYNQLKKQFPETFLPVFQSEKYNYATIRFRKNTELDQLIPKSNDVFKIKYTIRKTIGEGAVVRVNAHIEEIKLVNRAPPVDLGDAIPLDSDEEEVNT